MPNVTMKQNIGVEPSPLFGRRVIYYDADKITAENIEDALCKALEIHAKNEAEIEQLYGIYKGEMAVLGKQKDVREEINNKIAANFPNAVVSFHTGYFLGKPIQYVSRGEKTENENKTVSDWIDDLNRFAEDCSKPSDDTTLAEWMFICGTAYRLALPAEYQDSESPFDTFVLDPRDSFVVYSSDVGHKRLMGVTKVKRASGEIVYNCYTDTEFFKLVTPTAVIQAPYAGSFKIEVQENQYIGRVPVVEYPTCEARLGAFELILPLCDAINMALSDMADGRQQFVNALMVISGADITDEQFMQMRELGGVKVPEGGDIKYLVSELNQTQGTDAVNLMIDIMLQIAHMPKRSGGNGGTSDNGVAVVLRDGFADAEGYANRIERIFKKSENEFLRIALRICSVKEPTFKLRLSDVEPHFTRLNTDNLLAKVQALTTMLASNKIHPELAWEIAKLHSDPNAAYMLSKEYEESVLAREEQMLADSVGTDHTDSDGDAE